MNLQNIYKLIEHKGPNQTIVLNNPTSVEMFEATQQISHHIIIYNHEPNDQFFIGRGWINVQTPALADGYRHYVPSRLRPKTWEDFWGIYDYREHTQSLMERIRNNSIIVDIGTYHGKCAAHMSHLSSLYNKNSTIFTIEPYGWTPGYRPHPKLSWHRNILSWQDSGLNNSINSIVGLSLKSLNLFNNNSIDHVHLDGSAPSKNYQTEISLWINKIKQDGSIAGVNYSNEFVSSAVNKSFDDVIIKRDLDIWIAFKRNYKI